MARLPSWYQRAGRLLDLPLNEVGGSVACTAQSHCAAGRLFARSE
jgi:hypothetical protein